MGRPKSRIWVRACLSVCCATATEMDLHLFCPVIPITSQQVHFAAQSWAGSDRLSTSLAKIFTAVMCCLHLATCIFTHRGLRQLFFGGTWSRSGFSHGRCHWFFLELREASDYSIALLCMYAYLNVHTRTYENTPGMYTCVLCLWYIQLHGFLGKNHETLWGNIRFYI